jgi:antitoxin VapB
MPINVNNAEADALTRKFARIAGVGITDAIIIAMKEAIERRRNAETPLQTAARLREKHAIALTPSARKPLPRAAWDKMWDAK